MQDLGFQLAAFLLDPDRASFSMDSLAGYYLRHETIKYASLVGTGAKQITLRLTSWDQRGQYRRMVEEVLPRVGSVRAPGAAR